MLGNEDTQTIREQAAVFSALSDPTRLKLLRLLYRQRPHDALCVNALARFLSVSQPAISQHLRVLKSVGLIEGERRGYHIHYFVNSRAMERCRELISLALPPEALNENQGAAKESPIE